MALPVITIDGRLVADPELRFTPTGKAVATFRIAASKQKRQEDGSWADESKIFLEVTAWEAMAENIVECLTKGDAAVVVGELFQREFEDREGNKRTVYTVRAYNVAPSLKFNAAEIKRTQRAKPAQAKAKPQKSEEDVWGVSEEEPPF